jgi:hypothetical protein
VYHALIFMYDYTFFYRLALLMSLSSIDWNSILLMKLWSVMLISQKVIYKLILANVATAELVSRQKIKEVRDAR